MEYIIVRNEVTIISPKGIQKVEEKLAAFYLPSIGRHRIYRQSFNNPSRGMKLFKYKRKKYAQEIADYLSEISNSRWEVEEINTYNLNIGDKFKDENAYLVYVGFEDNKFIFQDEFTGVEIDLTRKEMQELLKNQ
jgi:hypothetical protein